MTKATRTVDVVTNGTTAQVSLIVDRNAQNEEAIGRALVHNSDLVSDSNRLPVAVTFPSSQAITNAGIGAVDDAAAGSDSASSSLVGLIKRLLSRLTTLFQGTAGAPSTNVVTVQGVASMTALKVDGSEVTQPVSLGVLPSLATGTNAIGSITNTSFAATQSGTWNLTNITGTISLPTGAATADKQPALGVAGAASTDVITVQGVSSMTPLSVVLPAVQRTPTLSRVTTTGTIAANAVQISIANVGGANATVAGGILDSGLSVEFAARTGETLASVEYDATGTTLLIGRIE